ncbi:hypothetical protein D9M69_659210 [compost metagenome]
MLQVDQALVEHGAVAGVLTSHAEGMFHYGCAVHPSQGALVGEVAHHLIEALTFDASEQGVFRNFTVFEEQLAGVGTMQADLLQALADAETGGAGFEDEQRDALGLFFGIGLGC